jgi:hypothetical protein
LALRRALQNKVLLAAVGAIVVAWMIAPFRYFDSGLPLLTVFFAVRMIEKPCPTRLWGAGVFSGVTAFIGLNHGLYNLFIFLSLMAYSRWKSGPSSGGMLHFIPGVLVGLLPSVTVSILSPGYLEIFKALFVDSAQHATTVFTGYRLNIFSGAVSFWEIAAWMTALIFPLGALFVLRTIKTEEVKKNALFISGAFAAIVYAHHAFLRSDMIHLGEAIFPVIAGVVALPEALRLQKKKMARLCIVAGLFLLTVMAAVPRGNLFYKMPGLEKHSVLCNIGESKLWLPRGDAALLENIRTVIQNHVPEDGKILIAPILTTLYCVLHKTSPVWEIYSFKKAPPEREYRMIKQMESSNTDWALVGQNPLDRTGEFQFSKTHPLMQAYLEDNFKPVPISGLPAGYRLLKRVKSIS